MITDTDQPEPTDRRQSEWTSTHPEGHHQTTVANSTALSAREAGCCQDGRSASVVLVQNGAVLGVLPPVRLDLPWWPKMHDLVAAVRAEFGIEITVLRLLQANSDRVAGGSVTYLAETERPPNGPLSAWSGDPLTDDPRRQPWARPGGPAELLDWADDRLSGQGLTRTGPAEQMRSWNLSALWRIPTDAGLVWLKAVPPFFAHEGAVIDWIGDPVAPRLIDFAPGRVLIANITGADNHDLQDLAVLRPMVCLLTDLQQRAATALDVLTGVGVPDRRLPSMLPEIARVVEDWGNRLQPAEQRALDLLLDGLPQRLLAIAECGVPDTLVHGDFHSGNVAGDQHHQVILDWGDSYIGHPMLDELAFCGPLTPPGRSAARHWFVDDWTRIIPGSDPARAARLLEPMASLLAAVTYANFCRDIEPDERIYHESDGVRMLRAAAAQELET